MKSRSRDYHQGQNSEGPLNIQTPYDQKNRLRWHRNFRFNLTVFIPITLLAKRPFFANTTRNKKMLDEW